MGIVVTVTILWYFIIDICDTVESNAHVKILDCQEDIRKLLSPYNLEAMYAGNHRWGVYDKAYGKTLLHTVSARELLSLLRKLKQGKITVEDFWSYLRVEEAKHLKKLQKSKEL